MSVWLRKTKAPGSAPGGLVWNTPEDVVEVEDEDLALALLEIPDAGFLSVAAPADPAEEPEKAESDAPAKTARKTAAKAQAKTEIQE